MRHGRDVPYTDHRLPGRRDGQGLSLYSLNAVGALPTREVDGRRLVMPGSLREDHFAAMAFHSGRTKL